MANLPLENGKIDVTVFCLSLMGKNFIEFLLESRRVLRIGGLMMIAEVVSRFTSMEAFKDLITKLGFKARKQSTISDYFVIFVFEKISDVAKRVRKQAKKTKGETILKPCIYKKR